ncbi:MAG: S41 family peptidase [Pseudomonadota bacterium]
MKQTFVVIGVFLSLLFVSGCDGDAASGHAPVPSQDLHTIPMSPGAVDRWAEDLEYYRTELPRRHIDLFHNLTEPEFNTEIDRLLNELPELSEMQIEVALWRLTQRIGGGAEDGHTTVYNSSSRYTWAPLRFDIIENEVRIVGAHEGHEALLGATVVAVGENTIDDVVATLSKLTPYTENSQSAAFRISRLLGNLDALHALGFVPSPVEFPITVTDRTGSKQTLQLVVQSGASVPARDEEFERKFPDLGASQAKFSERLWFQPIEGLQAAYVSFERYPSPPDMDRFAKQLADHIDAANTRNLIIDFRENAGGNGFTGLRLAAGILNKDSIDWRNGVYVLIGKTTYSAAMMNAVNYRQILNAKLVGEPTGGNPVGYQDADGFTLPNSGLFVSYSKRLFRLQDEPSVGVQPDVLVPVTWEDYRQGTDAALAWIVDDIRSRN